jgi:hypothetical protein
MFLFCSLEGSTMNWKMDFDWDGALKHHSEALKGIIVALFAMLRDATVSRLPRPVYYAVLRILRPTESAVRRLIIIAARGLVVKVAPSRPMPKGHMIGRGGMPHSSFQLFDTRKDFPELRQHRVKYAKHPPRILFFGPDSRLDSLWSVPEPTVAPVPEIDGLVNAARLSRRLQALKLALDDLPRQARRMARWRVRREAMKSPKFKSPLRPGPPPGRRKRHIHPIDEILADCHALAWEAMKPDTS